MTKRNRKTTAKTSPDNERAWLEWKVVELKTELEKLPAGSGAGEDSLEDGC
jgi:hypothetical protein